MTSDQKVEAIRLASLWATARCQRAKLRLSHATHINGVSAIEVDARVERAEKDLSDYLEQFVQKGQ